MNNDTPIVLAVATYASRESAEEDYEAVKHAKRHGDFDHLAVAIVTKGADGHLDVDRHDSSAKHGAWGGALTGPRSWSPLPQPLSAPVSWASARPSAPVAARAWRVWRGPVASPGTSGGTFRRKRPVRWATCWSRANRV